MDGFKGFKDRSAEQILCDFYLADRVTDMGADEFNALMDSF
jgi:hypothetical protein